MRSAFFRELEAAARVDPNLIFITADLGFGVVDRLRTESPTQFLNVGVAEQNMTAVATGVALTGAKVFTYSIANFPTLRCLEQIRNDVAYHGADVVVVAVGGGLAYGALGMSHHATEDLAIMRAIPGLAVAAPGDPVEARAVMADLIASGGPAYLRLGREGEPVVHQAPVRAPRGASLPLREGDDVAILTTGAILDNARLAAELLAEHGVSASLRSFPWLDPLDVEAVRLAARRSELVATIEEHSVAGGLGSAVAEILAESPGGATLLRIGLPARFSSVVGDQDYLRCLYGLDPTAIAERIHKTLEDTRAHAGQIR